MTTAYDLIIRRTGGKLTKRGGILPGAGIATVTAIADDGTQSEAVVKVGGTTSNKEIVRRALRQLDWTPGPFLHYSYEWITS